MDDSVVFARWRQCVPHLVHPISICTVPVLLPAESLSVYRPPDMSRHVLGRPLFALKIAPARVGIWTPSNACFLEYTPQTAFRSVRPPFLHGAEHGRFNCIRQVASMCTSCDTFCFLGPTRPKSKSHTVFQSLQVQPFLGDRYVGVLWPNGWMDQDATWYEYDIVLDGHPAPPTAKRSTAAPAFRPTSIVAKRSPISATAELLFSEPTAECPYT